MLFQKHQIVGWLVCLFLKVIISWTLIRTDTQVFSVILVDYVVFTSYRMDGRCGKNLHVYDLGMQGLKILPIDPTAPYLYILSVIFLNSGLWLTWGIYIYLLFLAFTSTKLEILELSEKSNFPSRKYNLSVDLNTVNTLETGNFHNSDPSSQVEGGWNYAGSYMRSPCDTLSSATQHTGKWGRCQLISVSSHPHSAEKSSNRAKNTCAVRLCWSFCDITWGNGLQLSHFP